MTSEERREARYQRRAAARRAKRDAACAEHDNYDEVFSYKHLYQSYKVLPSRCVVEGQRPENTRPNAPLNILHTYKPACSRKIQKPRLLRV